jgi:hypothetical protein
MSASESESKKKIVIPASALEPEQERGDNPVKLKQKEERGQERREERGQEQEEQEERGQ